MRKLTVDDIVDHRAYERERDDFRARVIAMKQRRRITLGEFVTVVFENTDTMRFQVQEMARAERMLTDDAIAGEVDTYNELIPDAGELSGTLFIELTNEGGLREWLPRLRGIELSIRFELGDGAEASTVTGIPRDEERLTRDDITSTVHYLRFPFTPEQRARLADGPVRLVVDHPEYPASVTLDDAQRAELAPGGGRALVPTGLAVAIPAGCAGFVLPRSGLALKFGVTCLNTPGLIDPQYRGELKVLLVNTDPSEPYVIERGDRIAQLVLQRVEAIDWCETERLDTTSRDTFGFGSTGT